MTIGTYQVSSANLENTFITYEEAGLPQANSINTAVWVWGWNTAFGLGLGENYRSESRIYTPTPLANRNLYPSPWSSSNVTSVFVPKGYYWGVLGIIKNEPDGTTSIWVSGRNDEGQGAQGHNSIYLTKPTRVPGITNAKVLGIQGEATTCLTEAGTLYSWGANWSGQLGTNEPLSVFRSSPVQIGSATNWNLLSTGHYHYHAINTSGQLYAWGRGNLGQLGQGARTDRSAPLQIGALTDWSFADAGDTITGSLKTTGQLWAWGNNIDGAIARPQATFVRVSSPVQIGTATNWSSLSAGGYHFVAVTTDGKLWTWGYNGSGELGLNDITHRSSPTQVGALTTWSKAYGTTDATFASKTDGTLWAVGGQDMWGHFGIAQSSLPSNGNYSSPVQVTSLGTDWSKVALGGMFCAAIRSNLYSRS